MTRLADQPAGRAAVARERRPSTEHAANSDYLPTCSTAEYEADSMETDRTRRYTEKLTDNADSDSRQIPDTQTRNGVRHAIGLLTDAVANRLQLLPR